MTNQAVNLATPAEGEAPARITVVHRIFLVLVLVLTVIPGWRLLATLPTTQVTMEQAVPGEARPGNIVTVTGYGLDPAHIQALFLISDKDDAYQTEILSASGTSLRFKVPSRIPVGSVRIAIKSPDKAGLVEQMLYLKILEPVG